MEKKKKKGAWAGSSRCSQRPLLLGGGALRPTPAVPLRARPGPSCFPRGNRARLAHSGGAAGERARQARPGSTPGRSRSGMAPGRRARAAQVPRFLRAQTSA